MTKALLPSLRQSQGADIVAMVSVCGVPQPAVVILKLFIFRDPLFRILNNLR
ncbi:hypothetical protein XSR1_260016 [Xenorhabdus szentirmaii DSM 16338]|uniref:Uncharacterized protein n=1 Tax=Xenorhabdus szentirmaii DSM 16338 TaxID=1427518 RepID=W1IWQ9_9GAMM|nr:hypothetical protein XSR1_260016 [Xenorhabdus szentirmaii DSM 16338]